jgi:hypothetical protein
MAAYGALIATFMIVPAMSKRVQLTFAIASVYILWGSTFVAIRYVAQMLHPAFISGLRYVIASAISITYLLLRRRSIRLSGREWWQVTLLGLVMFTANTTLVNYGSKSRAAGRNQHEQDGLGRHLHGLRRIGTFDEPQHTWPIADQRECTGGKEHCRGNPANSPARYDSPYGALKSKASTKQRQIPVASTFPVPQQSSISISPQSADREGP